jgi:hypothetical protein
MSKSRNACRPAIGSIDNSVNPSRERGSAMTGPSATSPLPCAPEKVPSRSDLPTFVKSIAGRRLLSSHLCPSKPPLIARWMEARVTNVSARFSKSLARRRSSSVPPVLRLPRGDRLPLRVGNRIRSAAGQRDDVILDVAGTWTGRAPSPERTRLCSTSKLAVKRSIKGGREGAEENSRINPVHRLLAHENNVRVAVISTISSWPTPTPPISGFAVSPSRSPLRCSPQDRCLRRYHARVSLRPLGHHCRGDGELLALSSEPQ